jgi:hypothetical protein
MDFIANQSLKKLILQFLRCANQNSAGTEFDKFASKEENKTLESLVLRFNSFENKTTTSMSGK